MDNVYTPSDFGAIGDGIQNDTDSLQRLFNAAAGKTVVFADQLATYRTDSISVRSGTRLSGSMRLEIESTSIASVVTLEPHVVADQISLGIRRSPNLRRAIQVGAGCRIAVLEVVGGDGARGVRHNDGLINISGNDIWCGQLLSRDCDFPIVAKQCRGLTIDHVSIENYCRGFLAVHVKDLIVKSCRCVGRSPNTDQLPGYNGILIGALENAMFSNVLVEDAGEHGIYVGNGDSIGITFNSPIIRRSARTGFKAHAIDSQRVRGLTLVSPLIMDCVIGSRPGKNEEGILLSGVENCTITSPTVTRLENTVSSHDGIYINNCVDLTIDAARIDGAGRHGIFLNGESGVINRIYINNPVIRNCAHTGVRIEGDVADGGILRDITLLNCYIRGCGVCGVACITGGATSGVNQPVILTGWLKEVGETPKQIVNDPQVIDALIVL